MQKRRPDAARALWFGGTGIAVLLGGLALARMGPRGARRGEAALLALVSLAGRLADAQAAPAGGAGAATAGPGRIALRDWWPILRRTVAETAADRVLSVAGGVAFFTLLSLFPAVTAVVSLYALTADPATIGSLFAPVSDWLPAGAGGIIADQAARIRASGTGVLTAASALSIVLALWSANGGTKALIDSLNIAYDAVEGRSFLRLNLWSLVLTLGGIALLFALGAVAAALPAAVARLGLGAAGESLILIGRWPLTLAVLLLVLALLYRFGPDRPGAEWRWITPGAVLAALGLIGFSMLFSLYATRFTDFNKTYGSLGAVIGFLIWLWLSAAIVMIGAELNSEAEARSPDAPKNRPAALAEHLRAWLSGRH